MNFCAAGQKLISNEFSVSSVFVYLFPWFLLWSESNEKKRVKNKSSDKIIWTNVAFFLVEFFFPCSKHEFNYFLMFQDARRDGKWTEFQLVVDVWCLKYWMLSLRSGMLEYFKLSANFWMMFEIVVFSEKYSNKFRKKLHKM